MPLKREHIKVGTELIYRRKGRWQPWFAIVVDDGRWYYKSVEADDGGRTRYNVERLPDGEKFYEDDRGVQTRADRVAVAVLNVATLEWTPHIIHPNSLQLATDHFRKLTLEEIYRYEAKRQQEAEDASRTKIFTDRFERATGVTLQDTDKQKEFYFEMYGDKVEMDSEFLLTILEARNG